MDREEVWTEPDQISMRLQEGGLPPEAGADERQRHLFQMLLNREAKLQSATQEVHTLRKQQASEMKEVESYVAHIRGLLEDRECRTAECERDNEELRHELHQIKHQQETQSRELAEMLAQENLGDVDLSGPSEQVAYLLVERATLLERLEAVERNLESQTIAGNTNEVNHQEHVRHTTGAELRHHKEDMQKTIDGMTKQCSSQSPWKKLFGLRRSGQSKHIITPALIEEISRERNEQQRLERDLEEASRRLAMAHQDIRRLTNELDAAKNNSQDPNGAELHVTLQEVENLKKEVEKLKHCDMMKLQVAKEHNDILDADNRALREKVHIIEAENKSLLDQLTKNDAAKEDLKDRTSAPQNSSPASSAHEENQCHRRCQEAIENGWVQVKELQRQLQRLRDGQEELEERNEELESLLGEAQNASKEERHRHEGELEGLHRRIRSLEAELKKPDVQEKNQRHEEEAKTSDSYHLRDSAQERAALLEARLTEEKDWRKQLGLDLSAAQAALKKDKEALQIGERELKKLRLDVSGLQRECQQGKTLIKSLTQVKGEKTLLEEKVAQMELAHSRLKSEFECYKDGNETQQGLRERQLQEKTDQLTSELSSLQTAYNTLSNEMASERLQTTELQARLRSTAWEKLVAEEQKDELELQIQRVNKQLLWHQQHLSTTEEALSCRQKPEPDTAHIENIHSPEEKTKDSDLNQLSPLKQKLNHLQTNPGDEQLTSQHQIALQARVNEAQTLIKSQDSLLSQKAEEAKQMKQDLQRVQSLFTSAERELRYEKEKNMDLKRHNTLMDQEKLKLCAELQQAQTKLVQVEQKVHSQAAELECRQQKIRDLELQLARNSTNRSATTSLQEDLQTERERLIAADKKVLELQQQLKNAHHQLRLEEARASNSNRLERDSRDLSDNLSALRAQHQEEQITRKVLEQREEKLQQQVCSLRLKEASLTRTNTELSHRVQQLDTRLSILETELSKAREEAKDSQKSSHTLQEELLASQQECEKLQSELQQVFLQLDAHIRKYNEKQSQHKSKLFRAKQVFLKETGQRDATIKQLENELSLATISSSKEREMNHTIMLENEKLMEHKRELLLRISEAEETDSEGKRTASTLQHRVDILEMENKQLEDRTIKLSTQVSSLERALRNASFESFYSLENVKKVLLSGGLSDGLLHTSALSLTSGSTEHLNIPDATCRVKDSQHLLLDDTKATVSTQQPLELGYLNLTSQLVSPPATRDTQESSDNGCQT
ncbi:trichohyalin [Cololabis saira]|uniref:trichohyalin n=1 Tax=Cololabis saira TaxID=129043 RepID=UPI002AD36264|nr:trichohyalin [Cololabis saira]